MAQQPLNEFVGVGLYGLTESSRLLNVPARNIRRWLRGYNYRLHGEAKSMPPLWEPDLPQADEHLELSFRDLIELRFVSAFIDAGLGLHTVRTCLDYARQCVENDRPFSTRRFQTDGKTIFLESLERSGDAKLLDLKKHQYEFKDVVARTFKDLDIEDDAVARWRPYRGRDTIVVDPQRAFGQPIAAKSGVPTIVLADAVRAEGSIQRVAKLFEVALGVVRDAVAFEGALRAA
jgi:uncharacterized protein (DUF433 family)